MIYHFDVNISNGNLKLMISILGCPVQIRRDRMGEDKYRGNFIRLRKKMRTLLWIFNLESVINKQQNSTNHQRYRTSRQITISPLQNEG